MTMQSILDAVAGERDMTTDFVINPRLAWKFAGAAHDEAMARMRDEGEWFETIGAFFRVSKEAAWAGVQRGWAARASDP